MVVSVTTVFISEQKISYTAFLTDDLESLGAS